MSIIEDLVNVIAPHECIVCRAEGALLCQGCAKELGCVPERCYRCHRLQPGFRTCPPCRRQTALYSVRCATVYESTAKEVLHRLKFARAKAAAKTIARIMAQDISPAEGLLITHVPTANTRVRMRGYDQAALIARSVARLIDRPYLPLLARVGDQRQLGQDRDTRQQQMRQAFWVLNSASMQKKQLLLIDDVLTTGATCEAAARVLRDAGAARVSACVFAVA